MSDFARLHLCLKLVKSFRFCTMPAPFSTCNKKTLLIHYIRAYLNEHMEEIGSLIICWELVFCWMSLKICTYFFPYRILYQYLVYIHAYCMPLFGSSFQNGLFMICQTGVNFFHNYCKVCCKLENRMPVAFLIKKGHV